MKNVSLLILLTALTSNNITFAMQPVVITGAEQAEAEESSSIPSAQNKVYPIVNHLLVISQEELDAITNLENIQVQDGDTSKPLRDLQQLWLHNNQLTQLPSELGNLTNLQQLALHNNQLTQLPSELGNLSNLRQLRLNNNRLTLVPEELGNLTNLQVLGLDNIQLTLVPEELGNLTKLQFLGLHNNQLTQLPTQLGNLTNLVGLALSNNQLVAVPAELGNLTKLQKLWLHNNQLTLVPEELGNFTNLKILWLSNTKLESLPPALANLTSIIRISLMNNPFTKHEIIDSQSAKKTVASSVSFMLFNLAGQKILRIAKQVIKDNGCPIFVGLKKLTLENLTITNERDFFTVLALIEHNLPQIERFITETSAADTSDRTLQLLTTLKDSIRLYQWLLNLIYSNKIHLGYSHTRNWCFGEKEVDTSCKDVRDTILQLMDQHMINDALDAVKSNADNHIEDVD